VNDTLLRSNLLDLLHALGNDAQGILLGGGYGLYLKQLHLAQAGVRTLIGAELWPAPRATEDLDLMLSAELVADARSMTALRAALDKLDYKVIKGSEYLQFVRTVSATQVVKIDLLTAQLDVLKSFPAINADIRRARPVAADRPDLHAHPTDGALTLTESPLVIEVAGALSTAQAFSARVTIPHPFNYLLMKLTAYRDRRNDPDKDLGRHHALDVFRIVAMLTEPERDQVQANLRAFAGNAQVQSCVKLVRSDFASATAPGVLAMRAHPLWQNDQQLPVFLELLHEIIA
jgi:virulence-associated protein VapD